MSGAGEREWRERGPLTRRWHPHIDTRPESWEGGLGCAACGIPYRYYQRWPDRTPLLVSHGIRFTPGSRLHAYRAPSKEQIAERLRVRYGNRYSNRKGHHER